MRTLAIAAIAAALLLTGCSANDGLAAQYEEGSTKGYVTGDASVFIQPDSRGAAVSFASETDAGEPVTSNDYLGRVLVVNFWYAGCAPCRTEAPVLEAVFTEQGDDVDFLGVNTRDQAAQSINFATEFGVTYPSVLDANNGNMLLAFAETVPANAVPTTLVLDAEGRVAARISGQLDDPTLLDGYIDQVLSESA